MTDPDFKQAIVIMVEHGAVTVKVTIGGRGCDLAALLAVMGHVGAAMDEWRDSPRSRDPPVSAAAPRAESTSIPAPAGLRSRTMCGRQCETASLLQLARRLDKFLQRHEVDEAAREESWRRFLRSQELQPE